MTALPKGQYVRHYRYGFGLVTQSDDEETSVEFENYGVKRFLTQLMVLDLSNATPPPQFRAKWVKQPGSVALRSQVVGRPRFIRGADKQRTNEQTKKNPS
jgi:hypothetical protein